MPQSGQDATDELIEMVYNITNPDLVPGLFRDPQFPSYLRKFAIKAKAQKRLNTIVGDVGLHIGAGANKRCCYCRRY